MTKYFALTGVAGYIASRHLQAIKDTGNLLVAAVDPFDSVGLLDRFFPEASYFKEFERFDRHLEKLRKESTTQKVDYVSICSPNNLHDAHLRFALRIDADAICEKPLVLNPWNLDLLENLERETGRRIFTVLQLRIHPSLVELKKQIEKDKAYGITSSKYEVDLTYITSRGPWYRYSWKGDKAKSGGIATNIGVHFFDLLTWLFGEVKENYVHLAKIDKMSGYLELQNANVKWYLSIDRSDLPESLIEEGKSTYRSIRINGKDIEFTNGFTDLHTKVYKDILGGGGFGIEDARKAIEIVHFIRHAKVTLQHGVLHPYLNISNI